jgi:hypothetical protein
MPITVVTSAQIVIPAINNGYSDTSRTYNTDNNSLLVNIDNVTETTTAVTNMLDN